MTDCITAEEQKPENVEHTEHNASHTRLPLPPTVQLIVRQVKASTCGMAQTFPPV